MAAVILGPVSNLTHFIATTLVHPIYFPFPFVTALHAARVSIAYQNNVKTSGNWNRTPWATYLAGFLVMSWGGGVGSCILLGLYPPQLYSVYPWVAYLSVHIFLTAIFHFIPSALSPPLFDTLLFPIDAIIKLGSITSGLELVHSHPDPRLSQSLFLRLIIGAVACAGGGLAATTFAVWTPEWKFGTPVVLKGGLVATAEFWGGALAAFVYELFTASPPTYKYLLSSSMATQQGPMLTPLDARSAATVVLAAIFLWRVMLVHWVGYLRRATEKTVKTQ